MQPSTSIAVDEHGLDCGSSQVVDELEELLPPELYCMLCPLKDEHDTDVYAEGEASAGRCHVHTAAWYADE